MRNGPELRLVAPWYRWRRQAERLSVLPRGTRPVLQKYADPGLVNRFLEAPQASYRFVEEDYVHARECSPYEDTGLPASLGAGFRRTEVPKLFRPNHRRHYLVVCELHCEGPGFPDARFEQVCEMGFVIRRKTPERPATLEERKRTVAERIGVARAELMRRAADSMGVGLDGSLRIDPGRENGGETSIGYRVELADARAELGRLESLRGEPCWIEGWIPDPVRPELGRWTVVEDRPERIEELIHPLHPLAPRGDGSDGPTRGARLLFGLVPTQTASTDPDGSPRFESGGLYEIRAFVRRHEDRCPRRRERGDCSGPLVWSAATEPYRIASHGDLAGQKNVVTTAEMPDLAQLEAHRGPAGGLRMVTPDGSSLSLDETGGEPSGSLGGAGVCTFPIPLITIVARFVFNLFLPVVVFVFQLYFLLRLKLCIPPTLSIDAGLRAQVEALQGAGITLDGNASIEAGLRSAFNDAFPSAPDGAGMGNRLVAERSNTEVWELLRDLAGDSDDAPTSPLPDGLVLEERVEERPAVDALELVEAAR